VNRAVPRTAVAGCAVATVVDVDRLAVVVVDRRAVVVVVPT
jgi:hypothetical protein